MLTKEASVLTTINGCAGSKLLTSFPLWQSKDPSCVRGTSKSVYFTPLLLFTLALCRCRTNKFAAAALPSLQRYSCLLIGWTPHLIQLLIRLSHKRQMEHQRLKRAATADSLGKAVASNLLWVPRPGFLYL